MTGMGVRGGALLLTALVIRPLPAQGDAVRQYVQAQLDWRLIPGVSIIVVKAGEVIRAEAFGLANRERGESASVATVYHTGSVGKQFTAAAVLLLVEEERLGLDEPIVRHLSAAPQSWRAVTIRHLLTHTSGLGDYDNELQLDREYSRDELLQAIMRQPLAFSPGAGHRYSNAGYAVLGFIVEAVSGEHLGDFLARRVFAPLGMTSTGMVGRAPVPVAGFATGYRLASDVVVPAAPVSRSLNSTGDGSLYSTVHDMARWDAALYGNGLLSAASRRAMWTPVTLNDGTIRGYGFGWSITTVTGHRILEHGGSWQGFSSSIVRYPDDSITVVVLSNLTGVGNTSTVIAHRIARFYIPALKSAAWRAAPTIRIDSTALAPFEGEFELNGKRAHVRRQGRDLYVSLTGRGVARMIPVSRTEFIIEPDAIRFRYRLNGVRKPDLVIFEGREVPLRRVR